MNRAGASFTNIENVDAKTRKMRLLRANCFIILNTDCKGV